VADLFGLGSLAGGKKQQWVNANLDLITALNDHLGFQETQKALSMKPETLSRALQKAEKHHRPSITRADKAMNKSIVNETKLNEVVSEITRQGEALEQHTEADQQLLNHLVQFYELQSRANAMMADLVKSNLMLHNIYSANQSTHNR